MSKSGVIIINLPEGINVSRFEKELKLNFKNNFPNSTIKSLSRLIAIDHSIRRDKLKPIEEHAVICVNRLKLYIGNKVIINDNFSSIIELFTVAITPENTINFDQNLKTLYRDKHTNTLSDNEEINSSDKEPAIDFDKLDENNKDSFISENNVVNTIVEANYPDNTSEKKIMIKNILRYCADFFGIEESLELMNSNPELFRNLTDKAIKNQSNKEQLKNFIFTHISKILHQTQKISDMRSKAKSWSSKISLMSCIAVTSSVCFIVTGPALPLLLMPSIIATTKVSSLMNQFIDKNVINNLNFVKKETSLLNKYKKTMKNESNELGDKKYQKTELTNELIQNKLQKKSIITDGANLTDQNLKNELKEFRNLSKFIGLEDEKKFILNKIKIESLETSRVNIKKSGRQK